MYSTSFSNSRRPVYHPSSSRPASEQSLIDEVSYLHSLWRQGPPLKRKRGENPPAESSKKPRVEPQTQEKKKKNRKRKNKKTKGEGAPGEENPDGEQKPEGSRVPIDENWNPESQWDTENPSVKKDWVSETTKVEVRPLTKEEKLQFAQVKLQQKAARVFREFLTRDREDESLTTSSDDDDEEDEELEDGDRANDGNGTEGGQPSGALAKELHTQKFFEKMFEEDEELKRFYEQNCNCGAFECFVCAAIGEKVGKKFPDCVSLIQHAMKILRTKKKAAHRGYGRAICCLLGWNVDRLPSVAKSPNSDFKPRACIPPPDEDEFQGQAPEEGDNGKGTDFDGEKEASDDSDTKEEMDPDGEREASDDNDAKEEMDPDGEREASDDNDAKNDQDKEPALE